MERSRTFVAFSAADHRYYRQILGWTENKDLNLNFARDPLISAVPSEDKIPFKQKCRELMNPGDRYVMLVGQDTRRSKHVRWGAEVALEKGCTIIAVNLDGSHQMDETACPSVIRNVGAIFVPFIPRVIAYALQNYCMADSGDWHYGEEAFRWMYPTSCSASAKMGFLAPGRIDPLAA